MATPKNQTNASDFNVDKMISQLLAVRNSKPGSKGVNLLESHITALVVQCREIFMDQPVFLELEAPINVCGDTHGQFYDLLRIFEHGGFPPDSNYLFLGDYVDRGAYNIENICLLFCFKLKYPENFFLLRGNHESPTINRIYGFYDECQRRYSVSLWKTFGECFNCLPVSAMIEDKILCMHGGLSPDLTDLNQIKAIERPSDVPDSGLFCDLLWSDPCKTSSGWGENERGVSFVFGPDVTKAFLKKNGLDLLCRAHQVVEDGYEFQVNRQVVTIFSAPNYCGQFDNSAAMMNVDSDFLCSFKILEPAEKKAGGFGMGGGFQFTQPQQQQQQQQQGKKKFGKGKKGKRNKGKKGRKNKFT